MEINTNRNVNEIKDSLLNLKTCHVKFNKILKNQLIIKRKLVDTHQQ